MLRYLATLGRSVVEAEPGVWVTNSPGGTHVELTFDPEAAAEKSSRELVTFGSPLLETALAQTLSSGRILHQHATARAVDPAVVESRIRTRLGFDRVRLQGLEPGRMVEARIYKVHFVISIHGDVVQQVACVVWVDGTTGRPADAYRTEAPRLALHETRQFVLPLDAEAKPEMVVATARAELERLTTARLGALGAELDRQRIAEEGRVRAYFRQREEELESKRARARSAEATARDAQTLAAVHAERDMRLRETENRYRPRVEARVAAVEVLHVPRYLAAIRVQKGTDTYLLPVRYDAALGSAGLPDCPSCGEPAELLIGLREVDKPGCGSCLGRTRPAAAVESQPAPSGEARVEAAPPPRSKRQPRPAPVQPVESAEPERRPRRREPEPLKLVSDLWLFVARAASRTSQQGLPRIRNLPERLARDLGTALAKGYGEPALEIERRAAGRETRFLGHGMANLVAEPLLIPDPYMAELVEELSDQALDLVRERSGPFAHGVVTSSGPGYSAVTAFQLGGVDHHLRVLVTFRVGPSEELARASERSSAAMMHVEGVLRRELGLTAGGDDLWLLLNTTRVDDCDAGARCCMRRLATLGRSSTIAAGELKQLLWTEANPDVRPKKGGRW